MSARRFTAGRSPVLGAAGPRHCWASVRARRVSPPPLREASRGRGAGRQAGEGAKILPSVKFPGGRCRCRWGAFSSCADVSSRQFRKREWGGVDRWREDGRERSRSSSIGCARALSHSECTNERVLPRSRTRMRAFPTPSQALSAPLRLSRWGAACDRGRQALYSLLSSPPFDALPRTSLCSARPGLPGQCGLAHATRMHACTAAAAWCAGRGKPLGVTARDLFLGCPISDSDNPRLECIRDSDPDAGMPVPARFLCRRTEPEPRAPTLPLALGVG